MEPVNPLIDLLAQYSFPFSDERALQDAVEAVLKEHGVDCLRESIIGAGERVDFLCEVYGKMVALECKVTGGPSEVLAQLLRYAQQPAIDRIVLVTSRHTHRFTTQELNGKPLAVHWVGGGAL